MENTVLTINKNYNTLNVDGSEIKISQYLPIRDKYDLISITLQRATVDEIINPVLEEMYFYANILFMYTDIVFSEEEKADPSEVYDKFKSSGILAEIISKIDKDEYNDLCELLNNTEEAYIKYSNTAASVIKKIINDLPQNAETAKKIVENFNPEQFQSVIDFATSANGGRNIFTNQMASKLAQK
jgi:hydrogenase maturation factor HypE